MGKETWIEPAAPRIDYRKYFRWKSIIDLDEIKRLFVGQEKFSFDTETTGLDFNIAKVAGFSFSFDGKNGYYVPILHKQDKNAPREALDFIVDRIINCAVVIMFNKKFDLNMLEVSEGYNIGVRLNVIDAQALIWLRDTVVEMPSLKNSSEHFLGVLQPKYDDVTGGNTFDYAKVSDVTEYASLDAICTYILPHDTLKKHRNLNSIFDIDNRAIEAIRIFEHHKIRMDVDFLRKEDKYCIERINEIESRIFKEAGISFNVNSNPQKAEALLRAGVILTEKTAKGGWKVDKYVLNRINHPLATLMLEHSDVTTYHGSFVKKLIEDSGEDGKIRFNYKPVAVVTGRFASGTDKGNTYYAKINAQNIPKAKQLEVAVVKDNNSVTGWSIFKDGVSEDIEAKTRHNMVLDTTFKAGYNECYICESGSYGKGIRNAFLPDDDESVFVSIDYSGEELRIAANMSNEPIWVQAFLNDHDIHMETAKSIWGEGADKNARRDAKSANFGLLYGGNDYTIHANTGMPRAEAKIFVEKYNAALPQLQAWKEYQIRTAKRDGVVYSAMGRPFRLSRYFMTNEWKIKLRGERFSINYPVQGTGGDIIRLALGRILMFREQMPISKEKFQFISTVHDEINFSVKKDWLHQFMRIVPGLMTMKFSEWKIPLLVDVSIGDNWGRCISYDYNEDSSIFTPSGKYYKAT